MEKVVKQVVINVMLIILSVGVIVLAKTLSLKEFNIENWQCYMGPDIMFVIISSLITTIGWRFAEKIEMHWFYNLIIVFIMIGFVTEYGIAIGYGSDLYNPIFSKMILFSLVLFLIISFVEYIGIIFYFKKSMCKESSATNIAWDFRYRD